MSVDTKSRRFEMVAVIEIRVGDEHVRHDFGRRVTMAHARAWARHYLDVFTGEPSSFSANEPAQGSGQ
ncbi:hypothetical protein [Sphingobium sp. Z007]|uniref:hypothetical protein n=1 Tax=Sphingobium sp. Z007 TaxID=627495 RepID=UPI0011250172|nr:hypothetical protein [Sphingobium sp. Z007]